jgi:2-phospho-L-lactate guanylyltransferase
LAEDSALVHALLPLKDLDQAKSRLSGLLRPGERRALALAMVEDVLEVLASHPGVTVVTLVSDDPFARLLASEWGAHWLVERTLGRSGLNRVIAAGVEHLQAAGAGRMMVLHGDLPLLTAEDISAALAGQADQGGLLIGPDLAGTGTNLLVFDPTCTPLFAFGPDSCQRHRDWAVSRGIAVSELHRTGIGADVDGVADFARLMTGSGLPPGRRTGELVRTLPLERILAALASLDATFAPVLSVANDNGEPRRRPPLTGLAERSPTERSPTERSPTERSPTERSPTERNQSLAETNWSDLDR